MTTKTILISGCAGFIGSHLARKLVNNYKVIGVDNFCLGFEKNIRDILNHENFTFHYKDIRNISSLDIKDVYLIYHLAAQTELYECQANPKEAIDINILGTVLMLDFAKKVNCEHFVFMDTSAEYDNLDPNDSISYSYPSLCVSGFISRDPIISTDKLWYPSREDIAPSFQTPMGFYSITKMAASQFVRAWSQENNKGSSIIRPFNVYGPSLNLNRDIPPVIGAFAKKLLKKENPIIYGDGSKRRDFIYVSDCIDFLEKIIEKRYGNTRSETYNLGRGINYSVFDIYKLVSTEILGANKDLWIEPIYKDDEKHQSLMNLADMSKTCSYFNWNPVVDIKEGIHETVKSIAKELRVEYESE